MKIMASIPITSWQIDEETMETVTDFILRSSKITQMVTQFSSVQLLSRVRLSATPWIAVRQASLSIAATKLKDTYSLEEKFWPT